MCIAVEAAYQAPAVNELGDFTKETGFVLGPDNEAIYPMTELSH